MNLYYYNKVLGIMNFIIWQGSLGVNPGILIGSFLVGILPYRPFPWKWSQDVYFLFSKAGNFETSITRVPYNKLLTNLACSSCTGEYWPSVVFVRTSGQYSPVRPSRSVSRRLVFFSPAKVAVKYMGQRLDIMGHNIMKSLV